MIHGGFIGVENKSSQGPQSLSRPHLLLSRCWENPAFGAPTCAKAWRDPPVWQTHVTSQLSDSLSKINQSFLQGKFRAWFHQLTSCQRLMWPLKLCDITSTTALKIDSKASNGWAITEVFPTWHCPGEASCSFHWRPLAWAMKARLVLELRDSPDLPVQDARTQVECNTDWRPCHQSSEALGNCWAASARQGWFWTGNETWRVRPAYS